MQNECQDKQPFALWRSKSWWIFNWALLIGSGVMFLSMILLFYSANRIVRKHSPLIQDIQDIEVNVTRAHLWFEEVISGDSTIKIEEIRFFFDQANQDAQALLEGGTLSFGTIKPVQEPQLRDNIKQVQFLLDELEQLTEQRWENISTSEIGSDIDQQYDTLFKELLAQTKKTYDGINQIITAESNIFRHSAKVLLGTLCAALVITAFLINYFLLYQHKSRFKLLSVNQTLEANEQQLRASNQQLQASEQQLRAAVQQLTANEAELGQLAKFPSENPSPVLRVLEDGTISYHNQASKPLLDTWQCAQSKKLPEPWLATVKQALNSGKPKQIEAECNERFFSLSCAPVTDMHYVNIYAMDVTARKSAEDALKSSVSLLTASLESTADGILIVDGSGKITQWNQKFIQMWRIPDDIISSRDDNAAIEHVLSQLANPDQFVAKVKDLYAHPDASSFDQLDFKDGRIFERYSQPQKIGAAVVGRVWSFRDVTARKQSETILRENEERFRLLYEEMPLGYQSLDTDGNVIDVNPAWLRLEGYSKEEVVGRSFADFLAADFPELFAERFPRFKAVGETHAAPFGMITKDGERIDVEIDGKIGHNADGSFKQTHCVLRNVTERNKAERERERLMRELKLKNEELQSIVYISSHDLKSPLVNINGFSNLLIEHSDQLKQLINDENISKKSEINQLLEKDISEDIEFIAHGTKKMETLINGLLKVSRIGTAVINMVKIDMNKTIRNIINSVAYNAQEIGAEIAFDDLNLCPCIGDPAQINQVFSNLIDNALKYTDPVRKTCIHISCECNDDKVVYCVQDNGIGINADYHGKVFEVFHRLDPGHSASGEGLGLTIIQRILDRHNGRVWIESTPGQGSKFFVSLPVNEEGL